MERRLAAILAADVVGYTRLMGANEAGTLRRLTALRQDVLEPLIAEHRGRVVKLMGDGLLVEFGSVVAAVECAIAWQRSVGEQAGEPLQFRIGVNLGDVIIEDGDLYGDGVNIAARLEALAEPGGICLSEDAQRQARGKVAAVFQDIGAQQLKNVAEPVRVFRVVAGDAEVLPDAASPGRSPIGQPTLALKPFRPLGDPALAYVTEGLTDTLSSALALFEEFAFVGADGTSETPTFLLEGSVQIAGSRARISAQLSHPASGRKVWGNTLDRSAEDVFALQDDVVGIIASTMGEAIPEESARALQDKPRAAFTAYDWTLAGIQQLHKVDPESLRAARASLERALELAPGLPLAEVALGWTYASELVNGWPPGRPDAYDFCVALTKSLLRQNDRYDQAHRLLARLYHFVGRHDEALDHSKRAYEINPYNSDMVVSYGLSLIFVGQAEAGVGHVARGIEINPYAPTYYQVYLALGYFLLGRHEDAVARLRGLERPIHASRLYLAASLAALDRLAEARAEIAAYLIEHPEATLARVLDAIPLRQDRDRATYRGALARAGLPPGDGSTPTESTPEEPAVAILPFDNMSGDPEQAYFADGITEDIITGLSRIAGLLVISRNSSFTYKGKAAKVQDVCRDLGVHYVLEGSVRKAGAHVRITAQLIDGRSGGHLWAERYDRGLEDIFAVQDDVTEQIVRALKVKLVDAPGGEQTRTETASTEAYDCFLRGRQQYRLFSKDGNAAARAHYEQAVALDPDYAAPYAGLAETYVQDWFMGSQPALDRAFDLAQQAKARDPSLPMVLEALSTVHLFTKQHAPAIAAARQWIEIEPSNAEAYATLAGALHFAGENAEVIELVGKAMRLNPFYPFYYPHYVGMANLAMRRYDDGVAALKRGLALSPEVLWPHAILAACYGHQGDEANARTHVDAVRRIHPAFSMAWAQAFLPYKRSADTDHLVDGLRKAGLEV